MIRLMQKIGQAGAQYIKDTGLSGAQFDLLATLARHPGLTQQALAEKLAVTKGNISQMIAKLEASGWVSRTPVNGSNQLDLTPKAASLMEKMLPEHDLFIDGCFAALTDTELLILLELLRKLERSQSKPG